MMFSLG